MNVTFKSTHGDDVDVYANGSRIGSIMAGALGWLATVNFKCEAFEKKADALAFAFERAALDPSTLCPTCGHGISDNGPHGSMICTKCGTYHGRDFDFADYRKIVSGKWADPSEEATGTICPFAFTIKGDEGRGFHGYFNVITGNITQAG